MVGKDRLARVVEVSSLNSRWVRSMTALAAVVMLLSGCRTGDSIGDDSWLQYDGDYRDAVLKCVRTVPSAIDAPSGFPGAAEFYDVTVVSEDVDSPVEHQSVMGTLRLSYTGAPEAIYTWACEVTERTEILRVTSLSAELQD